MSKRIAVIDDDRSHRGMVVLILQRQGYMVLEAGDGESGLFLIRTFQPDLIILDLSMPLMSGFDVSRLLNEDETTAAIPVLIISAMAKTVDIDALLATGARRFMTKPFKPADLLETVAELLGEPPKARWAAKPLG
jgi:DNA-binding response OmpR family regulator